MVRKEIDVNKPLTDVQKAMLQALESIPDEQDDDCPELTEAQLAQFKRIAEPKRKEHRKYLSQQGCKRLDR